MWDMGHSMGIRETTEKVRAIQLINDGKGKGHLIIHL